MAKKKKLRHGVIGLGIGRWHLGEFSNLSNVDVVAVADSDGAKLDAAKKEHPGLRPYKHYEELCEDAEVDSVSVCLPNSLHAPAAVRALRAGKHILCEKPLANCVKDGAKIVAAARQSGKVAMVAMKLRFMPEARYLRSQVDKGAFGDVYYCSSSYLRTVGGIPGMGGWFTTKKMSGGGALIDNGVHFLDLQWYLLGCPKPVSVNGVVRADFGPQLPGHFDVDDFAVGTIRFASGAVAFLENAWASMVPREVIGVRLLGTKGGGTMWPFGVVKGTVRKSRDATPPPQKLRAKSQFAHFADCVLKGAECIVPVRQGLVVLKMLDALYRSARAGKSQSV